MFLDFKYCSSKYITQGSNANANISGLYTNLIDIDGGKKLINNMTEQSMLTIESNEKNSQEMMQRILRKTSPVIVFLCSLFNLKKN